ncbi:unnamed protein product, partial [Didymodactylos carnosus]
MSDSMTTIIPASTHVGKPGALNFSNKYVKLNVGNFLYLTSFDTLTKQDNMFRAMFSGRNEVVQDGE